MEFHEKIKFENAIKSKIYNEKNLSKKESFDYLLCCDRRSYEFHIDNKVICDRANSFGSYSYPSCYKNVGNNMVVVYYYGPVGYHDINILLLCDECFNKLKKEFDKYQVFKLTKSDMDKIKKHYGK